MPARKDLTQIRSERFQRKTDAAAAALLDLYRVLNADFLTTVFTAEWMTDSERKCFAPLVAAIRDKAGRASA